jgi:hypothetical protein
MCARVELMFLLVLAAITDRRIVPAGAVTTTRTVHTLYTIVIMIIIINIIIYRSTPMRLTRERERTTGVQRPQRDCPVKRRSYEKRKAYMTLFLHSSVAQGRVLAYIAGYLFLIKKKKIVTYVLKLESAHVSAVISQIKRNLKFHLIRGIIIDGCRTARPATDGSYCYFNITCIGEKLRVKCESRIEQSS